MAPGFTWWDQESTGAFGTGTGARLTDRALVSPTLTDRVLVEGAELTDRATLGPTLTILVDEE